MRFALALAVPLVTFGLLSGCTEDKPAPKAPVEAPKPAVKPKPVVRFVQASTLKLRASASKDGKVRGRVAINSPLEVLGEEGGFARVRVKNGKEGYVAAAYLGPEPVTVEESRQRAANTVAPKERLSWLQRAAALEPTNLDVLRELKAAYALAENARAEEMVGKLIGRLEGVEAAKRGTLLAVHHEGIEWRSLDFDAEFTEGPVAAARWGEFGLVPEAELWALPAAGPAVRINPKTLRQEVWNECGGENGLTLDVGAGYVLAHLGPPPSAWTRATRPWADADKAALKKRARARCDEGWTSCEVTVVANQGHGAVVRVMSTRALPDDDLEEFHIVDLRATAPDAPLTVIREKKTSGYITGDPGPVALRDVVGDDAPEVIHKDSCSSEVRTLDGETLFESAFRCCGC